MTRSLLVAPVADHAALARTCLGLLRALDRRGVKVAYVKPVAQPRAGGGPDQSAELVAAITALRPPEPVTTAQLEDLLGEGELYVVLEKIVAAWKPVYSGSDVVVIQGLSSGPSRLYASSLNQALARALDTDVVLAGSWPADGDAEEPGLRARPAVHAGTARAEPRHAAAPAVRRPRRPGPGRVPGRRRAQGRPAPGRGAQPQVGLAAGRRLRAAPAAEPPVPAGQLLLDLRRRVGQPDGQARPAAGDPAQPGLKETDLSAAEFLDLVELSREVRVQKQMGLRNDRLAGRNIALIFEKTSTRTRSAFEVAAHDEGAHVTYLGPEDSQLGRKESMKDAARVLGRMFDGIEFRGAAQEAVETLGAYAGVPVWNGLTDDWHPTQMLADVLTMRDHTSKPLPEVSYCYLGDGRNNVANSLLVTGALLGMDVRICAPVPLQPAAWAQAIAGKLAAESGARLAVTADVPAAVAGVDFLYTDVWLSMGEPAEAWDERIDVLRYQVNQGVVAATGNPAVKFLHCLPALHNRETEIGRKLYERRGLEALEVTEEVFESPASIVFDQAENRMHTIKAVMVATAGDLR